MICLKEDVRNYIAGFSSGMICQGGVVALLGLVLPIQLVVSLITIFFVSCIAYEEKKGFKPGALEIGFVTAPLFMLAYYNLYNNIYGLVLILILTILDNLKITGFVEEKKA
jgi:hypothetical protein